MLEIKTCPTCGKRRIRKVRRTVTRAVSGRQYTVPDLEFYECPDCGEKLYDQKASRVIEAHSPAFTHRRVSPKRKSSAA